MAFTTRLLIVTVVAALIFTVSLQASNVDCKGGKVKCSNNQTCCEAKVPGGYACCPYQFATCCADKLHCCPQNTDCDSAHRRCIPKPKQRFTPWTEISNNELELEDVNEISNRACPGGTQSCPDTFTCCAMITGGYGCCPMDGAVCCADKIHCCPRGTTCDTAGGRCTM